MDDLDEIVHYLAVSLANPTAAARFADRLQEAIDEVRSFPESGPRVENEYLPDTHVRKTLVGHYVLYYLPDAAAECIQVLRILYGRRDLREILQEFDI